ncbi:hypothetical protein ACRRTK_018354 [Alexandromys fortis]
MIQLKVTGNRAMGKRRGVSPSCQVQSRNVTEVDKAETAAKRPKVFCACESPVFLHRQRSAWLLQASCVEC